MNNVYNCCKICGKSLTGRQLSFCSDTCKNKYFQSYDSQTSRGTKKRNEMIASFGGKCSICSYDSSPKTLVFIKNYEKISLSLRDFANHDRAHLLSKLENAKLVCKNCYSEIENNDIKLNIKNTTFKAENFTKNLPPNIDHETALVLGVSGGVDSVVMLDLFTKQGFKNIIVAHLNHGVRKAANDDQEFVRKLAQNYGYPFVTKSIKPPTEGNLENELRNIRRQFLIETAIKYQAKYLALGHNADDQAETVLLNLLRGTGPTGLSGMNTIETTPETQISLLRPILNISRTEIESYARKYRLEWREDETNKDLSYNRNLIRHRLTPYFSSINEGYLQNIYRLTETMSDLNQFLSNEAEKYDLKDVRTLTSLPRPVLFELFLREYEKIARTRKDLSLKHLEALQDLISETHGTKFLELPNNILAKRSYCTLEFIPKITDNTLPSPTKLKVGRKIWGEWQFDVTPVKTFVASPKKDFLIIDKEALEGLTIRPWQSGDTIEKEGIRGKKKLQDLFTDGKISKDDRMRWPVVTGQNQEIIWVPFLAYQRNLTQKTENLVKITAKKGADEK